MFLSVEGCDAEIGFYCEELAVKGAPAAPGSDNGGERFSLSWSAAFLSCSAFDLLWS